MNQHLSTDLLVDYVHRELPPEDDALVHVHLAACAACRQAYDLEQALTESLRSAALAEEVELPSLVKAAVWQRVREAQPGPLARLAALLRPVVAIPVAAVLVLGGWFVSPLAHPSHPKIDATYYLQTHAAQAVQSPLSERSGPQAFEGVLGDSAARPALVRQVDATYAEAGTPDAVQ